MSDGDFAAMADDGLTLPPAAFAGPRILLAGRAERVAALGGAA